MSDLQTLARRVTGPLLVAALVMAAAAAAFAEQPSPPLLDKKNNRIWIDDGYVEFLMSPPAYPPQQYREDGAYLKTSAFVPRHRVAYDAAEAPGTVIIDTRRYALYYIEPGGTAIRYSVGVGREGYGWRGTEMVSAKRSWPDWRPPADMRARRPDLPAHMAGGPANPLGARALYLGNTLYRIHGSNEPESVGRSSSSGCFRMTNEDVIDLYERVKIGAKVVVL
jgi:lipoprotein-anchoring transpeptidase ErfK/SrfK